MIRSILLLSVLWGAAADGADWPTYRNDNRRSGVSAERLEFPLSLQWTHRGGAPRQAWSGPAKWDAYSGNAGLQSMRNFDPCHFVTVADGLLYYGSSHDNAVHALDLATGKERWVAFAEAPVRLPPTIHDGIAYVGSDDGFLYALDAATGRPAWKHHLAPRERRIPSNGALISLWPVRTSALVAHGRVYAAASLTPWESSWLVALDPATGQRMAEQELSSVTLQGSLLATTGSLIAPQGRSSPLLFEAASLASKGTIGHAGGVFCLVTEDEQILAGPNNQKPKDSQLLLTDAEGRKFATFNDTNRAAIAEGVAYLHAQGRLRAVLLGQEGPTQWATPTPVPSELVVCANAVVVGFADSLAAYSRDSGELLWEVEVPGRVHGLAIADGRLIASTSTGDIHSFGP